jgi:hypothetical protein
MADTLSVWLGRHCRMPAMCRAGHVRPGQVQVQHCGRKSERGKATHHHQANLIGHGSLTVAASRALAIRECPAARTAGTRYSQS